MINSYPGLWLGPCARLLLGLRMERVLGAPTWIGVRLSFSVYALGLQSRRIFTAMRSAYPRAWLLMRCVGSRARIAVARPAWARWGLASASVSSPVQVGLKWARPTVIDVGY